MAISSPTVLILSTWFTPTQAAWGTILTSTTTQTGSARFATAKQNIITIAAGIITEG
jgi:hypothetical protein